MEEGDTAAILIQPPCAEFVTESTLGTAKIRNGRSPPAVISDYGFGLHEPIKPLRQDEDGIDSPIPPARPIGGLRGLYA